MRTLKRLAGLILCGCLGGVATARADAVVDWNEIAVAAIVAANAAGRPGPASSLDYAKVHAAIYDAVQAIEGRFKPYAVVIHNASGSSAAAAAKAAHDVLVSLLPAQATTLDEAYLAYFQTHGLDLNDPGVAVGATAAAGILALRANEGSYSVNPPSFIGGTASGEWRPTPSYLPGPPPSLAPMATPWLGAVTPFTLKSPSQFCAAPPPALWSRRYARDYEEVKSLGALNSLDRTPEQTELAYFWNDNYFVLWNRAVRAIAIAEVHDIAESARLFALVTMSIADAVITAWDSKRHYNFWRPVTAIQNGDADFNRHTQGDPTWQPLVNTPNYPDYTSGANNVTGAATRALALYFGTDTMTFDVWSGNPNATRSPRTYTRFSDAAQEVVDARIYEGIHFRFADVAARRQGRLVARWSFKHFLRPVKDHHDDKDDDDKDPDEKGSR